MAAVLTCESLATMCTHARHCVQVEITACTKLKQSQCGGIYALHNWSCQMNKNKGHYLWNDIRHHGDTIRQVWSSLRLAPTSRWKQVLIKDEPAVSTEFKSLRKMDSDIDATVLEMSITLVSIVILIIVDTSICHLIVQWHNRLHVIRLK